MADERVVHIVHCVDTEGPLAEAPPRPGVHDRRAVFPRPLPDFATADMGAVIAAHRPAVLGSWEEISSMLAVATSDARRMALPDSAGNGWVFNWFCMDHVGFVDNPRGRAMGMHAVFDFYRDLVDAQGRGDGLHWHFHPMSTYGEANKCATSYLNSPGLYEILGRRVLDHRWFPRCNRPGFQDERPDSHWFLEQWIPFDYGNIAYRSLDEEANPDLAAGRFSDWRWAPDDWRTYHPDPHCHQREGTCRRKIARCLNVLNRFSNLDEIEMEKAFRRAADGLPTLVSFASHDWRDLTIEVAYVQHLLRLMARRHPGVRFRYGEAVEAFNTVHPAPAAPAIKLRCELSFGDDIRPRRLTIRPEQGRIFGSQPFLAVRSRSRKIIHDNLNYWTSPEDFHYVFDDQSIEPDDVKTVGVAVNDAAGNQSIHVVEIDEVAAPGATVEF